MHHTERKSFELPCGMTVAESWGGLRKAWLGFKIALANNNALLMTHYATFIRKVQTEMGIQVTEFDPGIIDDVDDNETETIAPYEASTSSDSTAQEHPVDYDSMMEDARCNIDRKHETIAVPRQNIFESSLSNSRNACLYPRESSAYKSKTEIYKRRTTHIRKSCINIRQRRLISQDEKIENLETQDEIQEVETKDDDYFYTRSNNENEYEPAEEHRSRQDETYNEDNEDNEEKEVTRRRNSCSYERKHRNSCSYERRGTVSHDLYPQ